MPRKRKKDLERTINSLVLSVKEKERSNKTLSTQFIATKASK